MSEQEAPVQVTERVRSDQLSSLEAALRGNPEGLLACTSRVRPRRPTCARLLAAPGAKPVKPPWQSYAPCCSDRWTNPHLKFDHIRGEGQ